MSVDLILANNVQLSPSEIHVLQFFHNHLGGRTHGHHGELPPWEVYAKPYLNGIEPSFVLLNPEVGIALFEVSVLKSKDSWTEHPLDKLDRAKGAILSLYCPRLAMEIVKDARAWALISTNLVVTDMTDEQVARWHDQYAASRRQSQDQGTAKLPDDIGQIVADPEPSRYRCVRSLHQVLRARHVSIFPSLGFRSSKFMKPELSASVRSWLTPPASSNGSSQVPPLDGEQRRLATERDPLWRRVYGPAGSGKTLTLAARVSIHGEELQSVLVLSFNITLWHYIRALAFQFGNGQLRFHANVEWNHFHQWCIDRCLEAGLGEQYDDLWKGNHESALSRELPNLTRQALEVTNKKYDAVMIDEAQDFEFDWWQVVRSTVKRPGGRVYMVADRTQDLYRKASTWAKPEEADRTMKDFIESNETRGTGFRTEWFPLRTSYRLPTPIIQRLRDYASGLLSERPLLPEYPERGQLWPCSVTWTQVTSNAELAPAAVDAVVSIYGRVDREHLPLGELVLLTSTRELGRRCVAQLRTRLRLNDIQHTFVDLVEVPACLGGKAGSWDCQSEVGKLERLKKISFVETLDSPRVTTIKSFKGWEARAIVVVIEPGDAEENLREIYVALSRVKTDQSGSYVSVVCAEPRLAHLEHTWNFRYP